MNLRQDITTREIANLIEMPHEAIVCDFEQMLSDMADANLDVTEFQEFYTDQQGESRKQYRMNQDLSMALVAKYKLPKRCIIFLYWYDMEEPETNEQNSPEKTNMLHKFFNENFKQYATTAQL